MQTAAGCSGCCWATCFDCCCETNALIAAARHALIAAARHALVAAAMLLLGMLTFRCVERRARGHPRGHRRRHSSRRCGSPCTCQTPALTTHLTSGHTCSRTCTPTAATPRDASTGPRVDISCRAAAACFPPCRRPPPPRCPGGAAPDASCGSNVVHKVVQQTHPRAVGVKVAEVLVHGAAEVEHLSPLVLGHHVQHAMLVGQKTAEAVQQPEAAGQHQPPKVNRCAHLHRGTRVHAAATPVLGACRNTGVGCSAAHTRAVVISFNQRGD
eukprot:359869-Chlamydomonas_euryale.AAC.31